MSIGFLKIKCEIIFSERLDKPKNVPGTLVCGTPKRPRLILSPWGVVAIIFTAVAEGDLVGCVLVGVRTRGTPVTVFSTDVIIIGVPHRTEVIAFVHRIFKCTLTWNWRVGIVRAIPPVYRTMNVRSHAVFSFLSAFLFAMHSAHFSWSTLSLQKFLHSRQFIVSFPFLYLD